MRDDPERARKRLQDRMARVDAMTPEMRALVHDWGLTIVDAFTAMNPREPAHIRHAIQAVLRGSVEIGDRPAGSGKSLVQMRVANALNAIGSPLPLGQALATIRAFGFVLMPIEPTDQMVEASIEALRQDGLANQVVARPTKHRVRLRRALAVGAIKGTAE